MDTLSHLKLVTWNINGMRAVSREHFRPWIQKRDPDLVFLQEIKAFPEQFDDDLVCPEEFEAFYFPAERPGYSGTAVWVKKNLLHRVHEINCGLGIKEFDQEGRNVYIDIDDLSIWGAYFPNGQRDHNRVPYKLNFSQKLVDTALAHAESKKRKVVICGDVNTSHREIDLANPKENKETTGFLPIEREWISTFLDSGFTDTFRQIHGDIKDQYTWWTYRNDCRGRNIGWRLDYFFVQNEIRDRILNVSQFKDDLGSDHCPVLLEIKSP